MPARKAHSNPHRTRGERILALRKALNFTQADIATLCQVSRPQIVAVEQGETDGSISLLYCLATVLHTSSDYLIGLSDNPGEGWKAEEKRVKHLVLNRTQD